MFMIKDQINKMYESKEKKIYTHMTRGRLRRDVSGLRFSDEFAELVEAEVKQTEGVNKVETNVVTGRILVLFDHQTVTHDELVVIIEKIPVPNNKKRDKAKEETDNSIAKGHDHNSIDDSSRSIKQQIIQLCATGAILAFIFIKRRFCVCVSRRSSSCVCCSLF